MATRIKEGMIPYKGGIGIEITNNHIINVLLREVNNLIHVNENNELYVDLQLPDGIAPDDDFPVGVTTGKVLQADGWPQSGLILNWKTTSGDYARLIYANDGNVYIDIGDGIWRQISIDLSDLSNVKAFFPATLQETTEGQAMVDWYLDGKYPIVIYRSETYLLEARPTYRQLRFYDIHTTVMNLLDDGYSYTYRNALYATWDSDDVFQGWMLDEVVISPRTIDVSTNYAHPYNPLYPSSPATKKYVDDGLALKQDKLTAGTRITIDANNVISADVSGAMVYKGNVTDPSQLPSSGNTQGDCWYSESNGHMYAWDGTQWNDIGGVTPNLNNYFNKTIDDSDDITEGSTHLFVSPTEKNYWNSKQDALVAGDNIHIDPNTNIISADDTTYTGGSNISIDANNAINNDAPFEPDNAGSMGQVLTKTSNGYEWKPSAAAPYTAGHGVNIDANHEISNTLPFEPDNQGTVGQVIKKTANGYEWANESGGGATYSAGTGINIDANNEISNTMPFNPSGTPTSGYVIKSDGQGGYYWGQESGGGGQTYYGGTGITIDGNNYINNDGVLTVNGNSPDGNGNVNVTEFDPDNVGSNGQVLKKTANGYEWANESGGGNTYYAGDGIDIDSNNVISNEGVLTVNNQHPDASGNINVSGTNYTAGSGIRINSNDEIINDAPFDPDNVGTPGYFLKKTSNGYEWAEGGGFSPQSSGTAGQVLTKTSNGYDWDNLELPSGENNVKFWTINSNNVTTTELQEILDWVIDDSNNGAVVNDLYTNDVFIFHHATVVQGGNTSATFYGKKRITEVTTLSGSHNGEDITTGYEQRFIINTVPSIFCTVDANPDPSTHTNYISAIGSGYQTAFMPQSDREPATKLYVDTAIQGGGAGNAILSNTTGTTSRVQQIWVGTTAELNNLSQRDTSTLYIEF